MKMFFSKKDNSALYHEVVDATRMQAFRLILLGGCICGIFFFLFFLFFPPAYLIYNYFSAYYLFVTLLLLLGALIVPSSRVAWLEIGIQASLVTTFVPLTWYFVIGAWKQEWRLIDAFPPITGMIMVAVSIAILFSHSLRMRNFVLLMFCLNSTPILSYFLFHLEELNTIRGAELMANFGPMLLFLVIALPYQLGYVRYVQNLQSEHRKTQYEAGRDYLTDLINRRGFEAHMDDVEPNRSVALLLLDIDHFKDINDSFGHSVGDRVLIELASMLRAIYPEEHLVVRWGGEEFLVLLLDPDKRCLKEIAEDFRSSLSHADYRAISPRRLTVSVGVSELSALTNFDQLFEQADRALYEAKNNGRNQVRLFSRLTSPESLASTKRV